MLEISFGNLLNAIAAAVVLVAIVAGIVKGIFSVISSKKSKRDSVSKSFEKTVSQLSSDNSTSKLTAAILMRRYIGVYTRKRLILKNYYLRKEALNVISSTLRILPTSVFQKTIADGLAYTSNLCNEDLQKTNLQDVYLGNKKHRINMKKSDLYRADLSYALIENVNAAHAYFYYSILHGARIKSSNLSYADFRNAELSNCVFKDCNLYKANFNQAYHIPKEIEATLINGICECREKISTQLQEPTKVIFFSMPGAMTKSEEIIVNEYEALISSKGLKVECYTRDQYPQFGQLGKVRQKIRKCSGMVAFGFKQIGIEKAIFRPETIDEETWENRWLSTPWNELEVGMGLMNDIPILLVQDESVNFGVFDKAINECFVASLYTNTEIRSIEFNPNFIQWMSLVLRP